eukprot:7093458-Prymnesium_polylepis.1
MVVCSGGHDHSRPRLHSRPQSVARHPLQGTPHMRHRPLCVDMCGRPQKHKRNKQRSSSWAYAMALILVRTPWARHQVYTRSCPVRPMRKSMQPAGKQFATNESLRVSPALEASAAASTSRRHPLRSSVRFKAAWRGP